MKPQPIFLTAHWKNLIMANYAIDPAILKPYVPAGTTLDLWNNTCYVSLVGFMFLDTKVRGIAVPFHRNFEEVNLRFYVKRQAPDGTWRRGVVFVRELVPKAAITWVANTLYHENYRTCAMRHRWNQGEDLQISYSWKHQSQWHELAVTADTKAQDMIEGSEEQFIAEHYWGYAGSGTRSWEYAVEHVPWRVHSVNDHHIQLDVEANYGKDFAAALDRTPDSVFLAEGSEILVRGGERIA